MARILLAVCLASLLAGCAIPTRDVRAAGAWEMQRFSERVDRVRAAMLSAVMKMDFFVEETDSLGEQQSIVATGGGQRAIVELERLADGATLARVFASEPDAARRILAHAERGLNLP